MSEQPKLPPHDDESARDRSDAPEEPTPPYEATRTNPDGTVTTLTGTAEGGWTAATVNPSQVKLDFTPPGIDVKFAMAPEPDTLDYMELDRTYDPGFEVEEQDEFIVEAVNAYLAGKDKTTAMVRTTVPVVWLGLIATILSQIFDWKITAAELLPWSVPIALGYGVIYRALREVEARFPVVGRILFGSSAEPQYAPPPNS